MSLLLLFAYPAPLSIPISELVTTAPSASNGTVFQRPATSGEWRFVLELADPSDGDSALWRDITPYYAGDRYQRGGDDYLGRYRASLATVQLQIDDSDILAPWGQDTSSIFGTDVRLDAGLLMRFGLIRVDSGVVVEWAPIWTGRVESWGDGTEARGQIRKHVVSVVDTISDLANVPTQVFGNNVYWPEWLQENLYAANWLFGVDYWGDLTSIGYIQDVNLVAAINRMDQGADPAGLVWRSLRSGRLVVHPAPWDTTNTTRYDNPLLDVYPDGLKFSYFPDLTDIEYIQDDGEQSFGVPRTVAGIINSIIVTSSGDPDVYAIDDPVSAARYGVRPMTATWINDNHPAVDDILAARAYSSAQALPLRTTLDREGFWSAMTLIDQYDPVTVVHATQDDGTVLTATGVIRNIVEERTYNGESADGDSSLNWQSTVQIDIDATETSPALLPVEDLALVAAFSPGNGGQAGAEFSWTNPVQPDITPTDVQFRVIGRSLIWYSEDYSGVGADGTTVNWLEALTPYVFQVRLIRRVNGVIVAVSAARQIRFTTPVRILPTPVPDGTDTDADVAEPPDFDDEACVMEVELQENDGTGWVTVDEFTASELTDNGDGTWSLTYPIDNSFFNEGSMYRFQSREVCGGIDGEWFVGTAFDPPDDWADPCTTPPALSNPPYNDPSLIVYVPQICAPDIIREYVSGIAGVHGDALQDILALIDDPNQRALLAIAEPFWSATPGGIMAVGECPQIVGETGDKKISIRTNIANNDFCVLGECAALRLTAANGTGTKWIAGATVFTVEGTISLLSGDLDLDTPTVITATYEKATGTLTLLVDDVPVDSDTVGAEARTINVLPIWRVGAPPESWVTDFALWNSIGASSGLQAAILATGPKRYYTCEGALPFTDLGTLGLDTTSSSGSLTTDGELGDDGRTYLRLDNTGSVIAGYDDQGSFFPNSQQTFLVFLKPDAVTGPQFIVRQSDGTNDRGELLIDDDPGLGGNRIFYAGGNASQLVYYYSANGGVAAGSWNMYTFRQQGVLDEWKKNNVDVSDNAVISGAGLDAVTRFQLGNSYAGGVAHIATWDRLLSPAELTDIYNAAVADGWTI